MLTNLTVLKLGPLTLFQCGCCEATFPSKVEPEEKRLKPYDPENGKYLEKCPYCKGEKK